MSDAAAAQDRAAYPPLDTPKPVADGVWIVDSAPVRILGLALPIRMTVIRLAGGDLLLHSPTRFNGVLKQELDRIGRVRHLVAPSVGHLMFLADWQRRCPDAVTWATPGLRERGPVRRAGIRVDHDLGEMPPEAWADEIDQAVVRGGAGFSET